MKEPMTARTTGGEVGPATSAGAPGGPGVPRFSHEALFYATDAGFMAGALPFVAEGVAAGESVLVVVDRPKIATLRSALGDAAGAVRFADMGVVGENPARIIPAWQAFVDEQVESGRRFRGVGEPISPRRSAAALVECQLHESLLNRAFGGGPAWRLLCPYDVTTLGPEVLAEAARSHPTLVEGGVARCSPTYGGGCDPDPDFGPELTEPVPPVREVEIDQWSLPAVRLLVGRQAAGAGLAPGMVEDLVVAVNELATNTVRHGGGRGRLLVWREPGALLCEVRDRGRLAEPLVGRRRPPSDDERGRGLWLVNQLCDLVQIRSGPEGTAVRLHLHLA